MLSRRPSALEAPAGKRYFDAELSALSELTRTIPHAEGRTQDTHTCRNRVCPPFNAHPVASNTN